MKTQLVFEGETYDLKPMGENKQCKDCKWYRSNILDISLGVCNHAEEFTRGRRTRPELKCNEWKPKEKGGRMSNEFESLPNMPHYATAGNSISGGCLYCSNPSAGYFIIHNGICPKIKEIEYYPNGTVKRTVFKEASNE